jgi:superfamily II DNA or RNA helicase
MSTLTIAANAVVAKLVDASKEAKQELQQVLSYRVEGFEHMRGVGTGWDGRASFFEFAPATFPAGFVMYAKARLEQKGYRVNIVRKPLPEALGPESPVVDAFPEDPRYDYQREVVARLLRHGQIIAQVATGGGKSRIAKLAHARLGRRTLFLTTRGILMHQMKDAFVRDMHVKVGTFGDGSWTKPELMNVGMVQTFAARLKDEARAAETIELLRSFEFVILEEAHESSGTSYFEILRECRAAHYRLALTATPFMKDDEAANMRLMASSGPVAIKVSEQTLIERGILAKPYFKIVVNGEPEVVGYVKPEKGHGSEPKLAKLYRSTPYQKAYEIGISGNVQRNGLIVREATRAVDYGMTVMVLVQHMAHGQLLAEQMTAAGIRCNFIRGEHDQAERQAAIAALKAGKIDVLIGSTILDVGVDVPAVGMVILAGGGKAEVALRQRIGRGLRAKAKGQPNVALIVDFTDPVNNHLRDHARTRKAYIKSTPGFAEGILPPGIDFPYERLGFRKKEAQPA